VDEDDTTLHVPVRPDGTPMAFFYDRHGQHMIYRHPDGTYEAIGFQCRHTVEAQSE
jgi:hypothetical protein